MFYNAWYRNQLNRLIVKNVLCFSVWKDLSSGFGCLFTELFKKSRQQVAHLTTIFLTKMNLIAYLISCLHPPSLNPFYFVLLTWAQTIYNSLERKINGSVFSPLCSRTKEYRTSSSHKGVARCGVFSMHAVITVLSKWPAWLWRTMALWGRLPYLGWCFPF